MINCNYFLLNLLVFFGKYLCLIMQYFCLYILKYNLYYSCFQHPYFLFILVLVDDSGNQESKKVHIQNLYRIVSYCENKADCRRTLQLNYFGEHFDDSKCISSKETACDNCQNKVNIE